MIKNILAGILISTILIGLSGCNKSPQVIKKETLTDFNNNLNNLSEEKQIRAMKRRTIRVSNYPKWESVRVGGPDSIALIKNPSEKVQLAAIRYNASAIRHINNPSEKVQLAAVKKKYSSLKFIKNPSEKVQSFVVYRNVEMLSYIKNPSKELQTMAVKRNPKAIRYIKNPSNELKIMAVQQNPEAICYIKNQSNELKIMAVEQNLKAFHCIHNPSKELQLIAIKQNPKAIRYIKNPSKEIQLMAINQNANTIDCIQNPSKELQIIAIKQNPKAIDYIKNPSKEIQLLAYGKVKVPFNKPKYSNNDTNIQLKTINGKLQITNNTKQFLKVLSLAEYKGNDIFNITSFSVPPEGVKTVDTTNSADIEIQSLKDKITFGYAIEYQVGNGKTQNLYKTNKYSINDIK